VKKALDDWPRFVMLWVRVNVGSPRWDDSQAWWCKGNGVRVKPTGWVWIALFVAGSLGAITANAGIRKRPTADTGQKKAREAQSVWKMGYRIEQRIVPRLDQLIRPKLKDRKYLAGDMVRERRERRLEKESLREGIEKQRQRLRESRRQRQREASRERTRRVGARQRKKRKWFQQGSFVQ